MKQASDDLLYRVYVTDMLQGVASGRYIKERFFDFLNRKPEAEVEPEEVVQGVVEKAGLRIIS